VVEFPSRQELPHSVFTFIDLVESKLYDATSILSKEDGAMRIGGSPQHTARLSQRYQALGYGKSALSFIESSSSFPCRRHSVGFVGRGPALEIHISDRNINDQDRTCLGRVVQGMDVLARVETSIEKKEVIDIVQVRHVQVHDVSRREL
jgi:cyclophilin family peptidyl-prolyl cis-trans isomerase